MIQNSQMLKPIAQLIEHMTAHKLDYLASYPAVVKKQRTDGSLDIQPDDTRFPELNARIRYGVPGVTAKVAPGGRVLLQFEGGNPKLPVACIWESSSVTKLEIKAGSIDIGNIAADQVALASKVDTALAAIAVWANTHIHKLVATPGASSPRMTDVADPTDVTTAPLSPSFPVGSATVKVST